MIKYKGLVTGSVLAGINFIKDIGAGFRNFFRGRSAGYDEELKSNASKLGTNAVIGLSINFESLGTNGDMILVVATDTAVEVR
ncbi:heavy metal-binding domain-containing protein [Gemella sp. zg-570]|uniref:heavy metal-binding domain-containing protein n=1 Tax=unclassified Gemella TaxID=2624949 RepID=UPI00209BB171|nr:heavy metal-binding domain-containing protein [Gemella sp. zg-570]